MISYQDICRANETLKFSDIKGKNYAEVPQRVKAFRMLYPQGFIITDMVSNDGGVCVFKATAGYYGENGEAYTLGTGTAYEKENSSYINKTSYIENCETSAVGRALGFLNIGSDTSIASYEEVANAINQQENDNNEESKPAQKPDHAQQPKPAPKSGKQKSEAQRKISAYVEQNGITMNEFVQYYDAAVEMGLVPRISSSNMTVSECDKLLDAVSTTFLKKRQSA
jgi:hypothetical protein